MSTHSETPTDLSVLGDKVTSQTEALKYELHGLRAELVMYMQQAMQIETFSYSAAALVFAAPIEGTNFEKTLVALVSVLIVFLARERILATRHRISRLGMYIFLSEKRLLPGWGWEHFVYRFRNADIPEIEKTITESLKKGYPTHNRQVDSTKKEQEKVAREFQKSSELLVKQINHIDSHPGFYQNLVYRRLDIVLAFVIVAVSLKIYLIFLPL
ncbi:hypothetical protein N9L47_12470 [Rhodobacteraceae bacterium]|nr:hypothetical protein [Paracoccaceae bacterium]